MVGFIGWLLLVGGLVVWEAVGLAQDADRWPTLSDMMRTLTRTLVGRWVLFGLWLWLGWHLFVRGWRFFLRG